MVEPVMSLAAIAKVLPAVLSFGRWAYKALSTDGWGDPEVAAIASLIAALNAAHGEASDGSYGDSTNLPDFQVLASAQGLAVTAFCAAYAERWAGAEQLLDPQRRSAEASIKTAIDCAIREPKIGSDLQVLTGCPTRTRLYHHLWAQFTSVDPDDEYSPLLKLEEAHEVESHFRQVWAFLLTTEAARPVVAWLQGGADDQRTRRHRTMLAWDTLSWRSNHVVGNVPRHAVLPHMPLNKMYIEPRVEPQQDEFHRRLPNDHVDANGRLLDGEPARSRQEPKFIQAWLNYWLSDGTGPALVTADFGHGKSLSARTFAARLAENYLGGATATSERWFPIFVRCVDDFGSNEPSIEKIVARAQRRQLAAQGRQLDLLHPCLELPGAEQRIVIIFDGLDEVHLDQRAQSLLFESIADRHCEYRRIVVFSRPGVVGGRETKAFSWINLAGFDDTQIDAWCFQWNEGPRGNGPSIDRQGLKQRNLAPLVRTPVLLFMAAYTWADEVEDGLAGVYEAFFNRLAHSKFDHDPDADPSGFHPVVGQAATAVQSALVRRDWIPADSTPVDAMLWLLGWVAWTHHQHAARDRALNRRRLIMLVEDELELGGERTIVGTIEQGLMVVLQTNLRDDDALIEYQHRSFREFLETRFWMWQIRRLGNGIGNVDKLLGARLFESKSRASDFLSALLARSPTAERSGILEWASTSLASDKLKACDRLGHVHEVKQFAEDQRCYVREVALAVACHLSPEGFTLEDSSVIQRLCMLFRLKDDHVSIQAPRLRAEHLDLSGETIIGAVLTDANLRGLNASRTLLIQCDFSRSNISGVNFESSTLFRCNFEKSYAIESKGPLLGFLADDTPLNSYWGNCRLMNSNLTNARLPHSYWLGATCSDSTAGGLNLHGADLGQSSWLEMVEPPDWDRCARAPDVVTLRSESSESQGEASSVSDSPEAPTSAETTGEQP